MKKTIYLILSMVLLFSAETAVAQSIDEGRRRTRNEQYEDAEKVFNDLMVKSPKNGEAYYWAGINYLESGDTVAAGAAFDKGLLNSPKYTLNHVGKGHLMLRSGNMAEAQNLFTLALKAKKKMRPLVNREIARAYLMVKDRDKNTILNYANKAMDHLKLASITDFEVKLLQGDASYFTNVLDKTESITRYIESGYINTESPLPLLREAYIYQRVKNFDLAMVRVDEALSKDINFAPGYRQKAELFGEMKKRDSAVFYYKEYLKRNNNLSARRRYTSALYLNQQYDDAIREAKELLKIKEFTNLYGVIAYAIVEKDDTSKVVNREGLEYFETYEEKHVNAANRSLSQSEKFYKGALLFRVGDVDAAWSLQRPVLEDTSRSITRWYDMAREMYYSKKKYDNVIDILLLKRKKTGNNTPYDMYFLGMSYRMTSQYEASNKIFAEIVEKDSSYLKGFHYLALNWQLMDPSDSTGNVTAAYMRWMGRMNAEERVKYKKDIEYAYRALADISDNNSAKMFENKEDKAAGYPRTIESYKKTIGLYDKVLEYDLEDESVKERRDVLAKFVASLEARRAKRR